MKILVTGATGQLGYECVRELARRGHELLGVGSKEFPLTDEGQMKRIIEGFCPEGIIHSAAYTAVDLAEDEKEKCLAINAEGTRRLARLARKHNAKLLFISTDYVFDGSGDKAYEVNDAKGPLNTYGRSKLMGEEAVREELADYFIVRISWVFGINGNNFINTMLKLAEENNDNSNLNIVGDQIGSPSYAVDLARLISDIIVTDKYGVYHATNEGFTSWAEFASEIFRQTKKNIKVDPIPSEARITKATRPKNSRLSKKSLDENGFMRLPSWQNAVGRFLTEIEEQRRNKDDL